MLYFRQKTFKKIPFMSLFEKTDKLSCLKFLIYTWKQLFILAWKKLTRLVLDVFWIWLCCFLHWKNISQSLFGKHTYFFHMLLYVFLHSTGFCFPSSERSLCPYCWVFYFSSLERLHYLSQDFSVFLCYFGSI